MAVRRYLNYATTILAALVLAACGSSGGSSTSSSTTTSSGVSDAVPTDVVLASPTESSSASSNISASKGVKALAGDAAGQSYEEKKAAAEALHAGTGECGFTPSLTIPTPPECYGPEIDTANHADGTFTQRYLPIRDVGFWNQNEGTEACAAAQMNFLINAVSTRVDTMINMFNNMVCVGKKAGLSLPAIGASTDFKTALGEKSTMSGITVNTATIERLANDSDGNAVYKSTVNVTIGTRTATAILKHIKTGDSTYKGKLSMTMSNDSSLGMMGGNNCGSSSGSVNAGVVSYVKSSATSVVYEMNFAEFCGSTASPLDSNNNISRTDAYDASTNPDGWGNDWNYALFNLNPSNGTGTVAYAWQAGSSDGRTRVLNATVTEASDGSASGVAYYGFGPNVNGTDALGSIEGFICSWVGPNGAINSTPRAHAALIATTPAKEVLKVQKQILTRAAGATEFTTTDANSMIEYAPTTGCDKIAGKESFTFQAVRNQVRTPLSHSNDITDSTLLNNELVNLSDITSNFTLPTAPADVGG